MTRGFTLIELLAVIAILAIATAVVAIGLGSASDLAAVQTLIADWKALDARARLLSRAQDDVAISTNLVLSASDWRLTLAPATAHAAPVSTVFIPGAIEVTMRAGDRESIPFDIRGCSPDYSLTVTRNGQRQTWQAAGLTGWIEGPVGEMPR